MKRHRETLRSYYKVKEANLKILNTIRFQLHDIPKWQNYGDSKNSIGIATNPYSQMVSFKWNISHLHGTLILFYLFKFILV